MLKLVFLNQKQGEKRTGLYSVYVGQKAGVRGYIIGCDYKGIAQIVNMFFDPISSKEAAQQVSPS